MVEAAAPSARAAEGAALGTAARHLARVEEANLRFFETAAEIVPQACWDMARRFDRRGRLFVCGTGPSESDAYHVSVEFLHPVLIGKPALPAMALEGDGAAKLSILGRQDDIALGIAISEDPRVARMLAAARAAGLLTIGLAGEWAPTAGEELDYRFAVPDRDPLVVQEVQETCYHVLYELVHVFLEQKSLLQPAGRARDNEMAGFEDLYPFLGDGPADPTEVLAEVRSSTLRKSRDIARLRAETWHLHAGALAAGARLLAEAFSAGRKVLAFGNGGSATDARDLVADLVRPALPGWRPLPAIDLTQDAAMLTAVGNDIGYDSVFVRQVIAYGEAGDVAVGFSTSGRSANVIAAFEQARRQGLSTIGFAGYDGGRMADPDLVDVLVVAPSTYIPRIQEAQATAYHILLGMTQALLEIGAD